MNDQTPLQLDLKEQQRLWLAETFSDLQDIAFAITANLVLGEDALSNAVYSILSQIDRGKCRASEKRRFCAWSRKIVRVQSRRIFGGDKAGRPFYEGDCRRDNAARHAEEVMKPSQRHTKPAATLSQLDKQKFIFAVDS